MKDDKHMELISENYERLINILKVEESLTVRQIHTFCPDLTLDQVDFICLALSRLRVIKVKRRWRGLRLIEETFSYGD